MLQFLTNNGTTHAVYQVKGSAIEAQLRVWKRLGQ